MLHRFLNALVVASAISITAAQNTQAAFSSGSGGFFRPDSEITVPVPEGGQFDITGLEIDEGVSVNFGGTAPLVTRIAREHIGVRGTPNAPQSSLFRTSPETFTFVPSRMAQAGNLSVSAQNVLVNGMIPAPRGNVSISLHGGSISLMSTSTIRGDASAIGASSATLTTAGAVFLESVPLPVTALAGAKAGNITIVPKGPKFDPPVKPLPLPIPLPGGLLLLSSALAFLLLGAKLQGRFKARPVQP